jgi:hypothetical protein
MVEFSTGTDQQPAPVDECRPTATCWGSPAEAGISNAEIDAALTVV